MKPEVGKWYLIRYSTKKSKRGYHGKAKCMAEPDVLSGEYYFFRKPNMPEDMRTHSYLLFHPKDVVRETTSELTYEELYEFWRNHVGNESIYC